MDKHIIKLGLIASLVMGATSVAHATTGSTALTFTGKIASASCNVSPSTTGGGNVDLKTWLPSEFPSTAGVLTSSEVSTSLMVTGCEGKLAVGDGLDLHADAVGAQSSNLTSNDLWGDDAANATNVGIQLTVNADSKTTALTPNANVIPLGATNAGTEPEDANKVVIGPVMINAALKSIAANTDVKPGTVKSAVVFSVMNP